MDESEETSFLPSRADSRTDSIGPILLDQEDDLEIVGRRSTDSLPAMSHLEPIVVSRTYTGDGVRRAKTLPTHAKRETTVMIAPDLRRNKTLMPYKRPKHMEPEPQVSSFLPNLMRSFTLSRTTKPMVEYSIVDYPTDMPNEFDSNSMDTPSQSMSVDHVLSHYDQGSPMHITAVNVVESPFVNAPSLRRRVSSSKSKQLQFAAKAALETKPAPDYYSHHVDPLRTRAFVRRALVFQKRQWFTNICCIALCPFVMIMTSFILITIISSLFSNGTKSFQVLYCSDQTSINEQNWPLKNLSNPGVSQSDPSKVPGATTTVLNANFWSLSSLIDLGSRDAFSQLATSSVNWFGEQTPIDQGNVYARPHFDQVNNYSTLDSLYATETSSGWLDILMPLQKGDFTSAFAKQAISLARALAIYQTRPWALVGMSGTVDPQLIGSAPQQPILNSTAMLWNGSQPFFKNSLVANGMLDTMEPRFYVAINATPLSFGGFQQVPFFQVSTNATLDMYDAILKSTIQDAVERLANVNDYLLQFGSPNDQQAAQIVSDINAATSVMPYGLIYFENVNPAGLQYSYTLQFGSDARLSNAPGFPTSGFRNILQQSQLTNAFVRFTGPFLNSTVITQGLRMMPFLTSQYPSIPFGGLIGRLLFPLGISFLLPIFTIGLVRDKESRVLAMMRMNGLPNATGYYLAVYVTNYILYAISTCVFVLFGYITSLPLFTRTEMGLLFLLMFFWGHAQIALSFWFNSLFKTSRTALVSAFLIVIISVVTSFIFDQVFIPIGSLPWVLFIWPPFAFYRALGLMNRVASSHFEVPISFATLTLTHEISIALMALAFGSVFYLLLAAYCTTVLPTGYGSRLPWHFPISTFFKKSPKVSRDDQKYSDQEDDDVRAERVRVLAGLPLDTPLVIQSVSKSFTSKVAVRDISLAVEKGTVFGLLGPNGAGKSSLINVLTGVYEPSAGHALLAGYDVKEDSESALRLIGVCPQFDILWDDLSCDEHLYFYARLKGVAKELEREAVQASKELVCLSSLSDRLAKQLSGGERRRLSIAIALVGDPKVVFLDEPTTGLDPEVRRVVWDIIARARGNRAILLTTHSMEEAEVCCQRIGIMAKGTLRCLGSLTRLKELYGTGYNLFVSGRSSALKASEMFLTQILPRNEYSIQVETYATLRHYVFRPTGPELAFIFESLNRFAISLGLEYWGVSETTLDEIFASIISEDDASA